MFHNQRALRQIIPARAKKTTRTALLGCIDEQKLDGERFTLHTGVGGPFEHAITSRRVSTQTGRMVEKTDRVPHIVSAPLQSQLVLDTEHAAIGDAKWALMPAWSWDHIMNPKHPHMQYFRDRGSIPVFSHVSQTASIMGSLAEEAIRKQRERGKVWAWCFDALYYQDKYIGNNEWIKRRNLLAQLTADCNPEEDGIVLMPAWQGLSISQKKELFELFTSTEYEGEGLIEKDPSEVYNAPSAWYKWKAEWPLDVVLTGGFTYGDEGKTGKMLGLAGNLEIGVYYKGSLRSIGWISAIMDSEGKLPALTKRAEAGELAGLVVGILCNGIQKKDGWYTLRHPRYYKKVGWRTDKAPEDCTFEAMMAELGHEV